MQGYVVAKGRRFYAVIYDGVDPLTGRERRRWHAAGTNRTDAERLAARLAAQAASKGRDAGLSLARYLRERWLPAKRVSLRPSTWDGYRRKLELQVIPRLGHVPLRRLRADHIQSLYSELLANGRADAGGGLDPKTVLEIHVILRKALADAARRSLIPRNVADDAEAPKRRRPKRQVRSWTAEQLHTFLDTAAHHRLFAAFWLAATTGMRRSELLALRWEDLDVDTSRVSVHRALVSVAYELHESHGKTSSARRCIDLDPDTITVIERWRDFLQRELGRPVLGCDYLFASPTGHPIHPDSFSGAFNRLVAKVDLPRLRLHDLRHTHATLLLKDGVPIKVVSERLGHATPGFTMATYQHVLPGMQAEAAHRFAELLKRAPVVGSPTDARRRDVEVEDGMRHAIAAPPRVGSPGQPDRDRSGYAGSLP
jgi:integrase